MEEQLDKLFEKYTRFEYYICDGSVVIDTNEEREYNDSSILKLDRFNSTIGILPFICSELGINIHYSRRLDRFRVYLGIDDGELSLRNFDFEAQLVFGIEAYINNNYDDLENAIIVIAERLRVAFEKMANIGFEVPLGKRAL